MQYNRIRKESLDIVTAWVFRLNQTPQEIKLPNCGFIVKEKNSAAQGRNAGNTLEIHLRGSRRLMRKILSP